MPGLFGLGIILLIIALAGWLYYRNDVAKPSWISILAIVGAILLLVGLFI